MIKNYVIDTTALISYFSDIFQEAKRDISKQAVEIIDRAFNNDSAVRISVSSITFVEIFEKWFSSEELAKKIKVEIFDRIRESENFEIKPLEREVIENFLLIQDNIVNLENHDKLILASAMMLNCPLISNDRKIKDYVEADKVIPKIIS